MRTIQKKGEPCSLLEHRKQPHADFNNYSDKDTLRQYLAEEQRGLCCYCQSRIRPDKKNMKIEHWQCQATYPNRQLDYRNLLGACLGGHGRPVREQHCDTRKGNLDLIYCPAEPTHDIGQRIRFLGNGHIQSIDDDFDAQLNDVLNLNYARLVSNRKAVLDAFKQRLQNGKKFDPLKELSKWDGSHVDELPEYSQVVVYFLKKRLDRTAL